MACKGNKINCQQKFINIIKCKFQRGNYVSYNDGITFEFYEIKNTSLTDKFKMKKMFKCYKPSYS